MDDVKRTLQPVAGEVELWWKWVVLVAVYLESVIVATSNYSSGVLYIALLDRYGSDKATTSLVLSIGGALLNVLAPIGSLIVNGYSCRVAIVTGGAVLTVSRLLSAFVTDIDTLLFTYGILGGIGYSMTYPITSIVLGFYFKKHRDLVISLSVAMVAIGMFAASPPTLHLLDLFGLSGTFMMQGAMCAQVCVVGVLCKPSPMEINVQKERFTSKVDLSTDSEQHSCKHKCVHMLTSLRRRCDVSVLKVVPFVLFVFSNLTWMLMMSVCTNHLPNYAKIHGATEGQITLLMTCFSISNACGRFLATFTLGAGKLKHNSLIIQVCMLSFMGIVSIVFPFISHIEGRISSYVYAVVMGVCTGVPNALATPITLGLVGVDRISSANGYGLCCGGFGILVGPPIAGLLYGHTGSYKYSFIFGGCVCLVGSALSSSVLLLQKRRRNTPIHKQQQHTDVVDMDNNE